VRAFLRDEVTSIEQLEVLLVLVREPQRWWSADAVAEELRMSESVAADVLEKMASRNLFDVRTSEQLLFRYAPISLALDVAVRETARAYKETPDAVATAIYSPSMADVRSFAEAFRIRRRRRDEHGG
jgi:hypothetical protein